MKLIMGGKESNTERFGLRMSPSLWRGLNEFASETGRDLSEIVRTAIDKEIHAQRVICLDVPETERTALEKLSTRLRYRDAAQLMENLAAAALSAPPRAVIDFITGDLSAADNLPPRPASFAAADEYARRRMAEDKADKQRKEGAA